MKRFLVTVFVYLTILGAIIFSINWIYVEKTHDANKFDYVPSDIEICNLGSSHGLYGYNYQDIEDDYTCFNFALNSQSLSYDERILEYYQKNLSPGGVVVVDISFFSPWGYPENDKEDFESKNQRYYEILPPNMIKEYDLYTDLMIYRFPSLNAGIQSVFHTIIKDTNKDAEIPLSYPEINDVTNVSTLQKDVTAACKRHIFQNRRNENGELFLNEEETQALSQIAEICRKRNVTPIFVTCPYLKEYTDEIGRQDSDFYNQFYDWIYTTSNELGVDYYDYSLDERFIYDYSLFFNGDHMNSAGATKFTDILYEEVIKQRIK